MTLGIDPQDRHEMWRRIRLIAKNPLPWEQFAQSSDGNTICRHCGYYTGEHSVVEGVVTCPRGG